MFYDAIVNSREIAEQAECLLRDWKKEHEGYYAHNTIRIPYGAAQWQFEASCGFRAIPGGGSWLSSGNNFHAISVNDTLVRITFAGRRHGMRPEFRDLLKAASVWCEYETLSYQTEKPSWLPWETRDDQ